MEFSIGYKVLLSLLHDANDVRHELSLQKEPSGVSTPVFLTATGKSPLLGGGSESAFVAMFDWKPWADPHGGGTADLKMGRMTRPCSKRS